MYILCFTIISNRRGQSHSATKNIRRCIYPQLQFPKWRNFVNFVFYFLIQKKKDFNRKIERPYNLNVIHHTQTHSPNIFQAIFPVKPKDFSFLCSHYYAWFWIRFVRLHYEFFFNEERKKKSKHLKSESECSHTFDQLLF